MKSVDLPGSVVESQKMGPNWVVFFAHVPWPSVFRAEDIDPDADMESCFQDMWWEKHARLSQPSPLLTRLLQRLQPYQTYSAGDVLRAFIHAGYAFDLLAEEQIVERLQLMSRWNGWTRQSHPGVLWASGRHHGHKMRQTVDA